MNTNGLPQSRYGDEAPRSTVCGRVGPNFGKGGIPWRRLRSSRRLCITRSVQQGQLQRSSLFLVHAFPRRLLVLQSQFTTERFGIRIQIPLAKERKSLQWARPRSCKRVPGQGSLFESTGSQCAERLQSRLFLQNRLRIGHVERATYLSNQHSSRSPTRRR